MTNPPRRIPHVVPSEPTDEPGARPRWDASERNAVKAFVAVVGTCGFFGALIGAELVGLMPSSTPTDWVDLVMAWIREIGPFGLVGLVLGMVPGFLAALVVWLFAPRD